MRIQRRQERKVLGSVTLPLALVLTLSAACRQDMHDTPRYEPLEATSFFLDGRSARPLVAGTVARGQLKTDTHLYLGTIGQELARSFPFPVTRSVMERGRERYDIYCSPCHDRVGSGEGMVVQRGFKKPPSFHEERLRSEPVGHFFDVISQGFGAMQDYAAQINVPDRWAIVAYIQALQLSQNAALEDLPEDERDKLAP